MTLSLSPQACAKHSSVAPKLPGFPQGATAPPPVPVPGAPPPVPGAHAAPQVPPVAHLKEDDTVFRLHAEVF